MDRPSVKRRILQLDRWHTSARWMTGQEHAGLVHTKGAGAVAIRDGGTVIRVRGRPRLTVPAGNLTAARQRDIILIKREGETVPLFLEDGAENNYQKPGRRLTKGEVDRYEADAVELALADHQRYGGLQNQITARLGVAVVIGMLFLGVIWLAVPAVGMFR